MMGDVCWAGGGKLHVRDQDSEKRIFRQRTPQVQARDGERWYIGRSKEAQALRETQCGPKEKIGGCAQEKDEVLRFFDFQGG